MSTSTAAQDPATSHDTAWGVFLFTDLEGSTRSWEESAPRMNAALAEHDRILRDVFATAGGRVFSTAGDAFAVHFESIAGAVQAAVEAQRRLRDAEWDLETQPLVRMGIHAGVAYRREDNWFGPCLNRCARIMGAGHGGQVLVSEVVAAELSSSGPDGVTAVARGLHRLKDLPEPVALYQLVVDDLPSDFPPPNSLHGPGTTIPHSPTSFVGREKELERVSELLAGADRVVTLVAPGGTGKTRLAYESARRASPEFGGGTYLVELADLAEGDVAYRFGAAVLGDEPLARIEAANDPVAAILSRLRRQTALVVVDNCEDVADAAASVIDALVRGCPDLTVLATSRTPLGVTGEHPVVLAPLQVDSDHGPGPAVELFVDRATAARPDLPLDDEQRQAIRSICEMVDGLPLGVELAAARCSARLPSELLPHLDRALRLLSDTSGAGRPDRHRSLEGIIRWSYAQLDDAARDLLQLCSVFSGGFDAAAVANLGEKVLGLDDLDVMDAVQSLIDLSLLAVSTDEGSTRYRASEPIRQFAQAALEESGRIGAARAAHYEWYLGVAGEHVPSIEEAPDPALINRLGLEHDNFMSAIARAIDRGDIVAARHLTVSLHTYWEESGYIASGARLLQRLVGIEPGEPPGDALRAALMEPAGAQSAGLLTTYSCMTGDLDLAQQLSDELAFLLEVDLPPRATAALAFTLGFVDRAAGNDERCAQRWTRAGEAALEGGDLLIARQAFWSAAYSSIMSEDHDAAHGQLHRAREVPLDHTGWFPHLADLLDDAMTLLAGTGDAPADAALDRIHRNASAVDDLGLRFRTLLTAAIVAPVMYGGDRPETAARWWRRGLEVSHDMGHLWGGWVLLELTGWDLEIQGRHAEAAERWGAVDGFAQRRGYRQWPMIVTRSERWRDSARRADPDAFAEAYDRGARRRGLSRIVASQLA